MCVQMPLLVVLTSIFMHAAMPYISLVLLPAFDSLPDRSRALVG